MWISLQLWTVKCRAIYALTNNQDEYLIPKDIYPILSNSFSAFPCFGITGEFSYEYKSKINIAVLSSLYFQSRENTDFGTYYSLDGKISIKDDVIRHISFIDLYISNIFFWGIEDQDKMVLGCSIGFKLPHRLNFMFDFNHLYYDNNLNGNLNGVTNLGCNLGITF